MNEDNIIKLPGSDKWEAGYRLGQRLEEQFPDEQPGDFAAMYSETDTPDAVANQIVVNLTCFKVGRNDEENWIWHVLLQDPITKQRSNYFVSAWCDYTGWDCQSGSIWYGVIS